VKRIVGGRSTAVSRFLAGIMLVLALVACAAGQQSAAGIVVDIDTLGLGRVQAFTLVTQAGETLVFDVTAGTDLSTGGFPPDHLWEHLATGVGVAVAYRTEGDERIAIRLDDAEWIGGSAAPTPASGSFEGAP
jgi:hypothetical protein